MVGLLEEQEELRKTVEEYRGGGKVTLHLSGLKLPATKNKIIEFARKSKFNTNPTIKALGMIPDRTYKNNDDLRETFGDTYHGLASDIMKKAAEKIGSFSPHRVKLAPQSNVDPTLTVSIK